ncbi:hypothetical protein CH63R_06216 [Colletotrichum higginsianum IMI 349063]|uniref:Uncharacterized protein n=1 Tax=Colletotrichum higginsianum (strain IMI 349063) TaxID=759273 RepID=A0A1B7YF51_COLHI|nr:hypothetical protein CH63R_06216 [Colletotrichum higginsianum IMI 349063]OBR10524.1 hypothetical protein CH63R_06216 [Colletotrichum higginsianum IMI 349063]
MSKGGRGASTLVPAAAAVTAISVDAMVTPARAHKQTPVFLDLHFLFTIFSSPRLLPPPPNAALAASSSRARNTPSKTGTWWGQHLPFSTIFPWNWQAWARGSGYVLLQGHERSNKANVWRRYAVDPVVPVPLIPTASAGFDPVISTKSVTSKSSASWQNGRLHRAQVVKSVSFALPGSTLPLAASSASSALVRITSYSPFPSPAESRPVASGLLRLGPSLPGPHGSSTPTGRLLHATHVRDSRGNPGYAWMPYAGCRMSLHSTRPSSSFCNAPPPPPGQSLSELFPVIDWAGLLCTPGLKLFNIIDDARRCHPYYRSVCHLHRIVCRPLFLGIPNLYASFHEVPSDTHAQTVRKSTLTMSIHVNLPWVHEPQGTRGTRPL